MRVSLSPAFSAARCRGMAPLMADSATAVVNYLMEIIKGEQAMDLNTVSCSANNKKLLFTFYKYFVFTSKGFL